MSMKTKTPEPVTAAIAPDSEGIEDFLTRVRAQLDVGESIILVDCAPLERVTSTHINALWQARDLCGQRSATMELLNVGHGLRRVLEVLDLTSVFFTDPPTTLPFKRVFAPTVEQIDEVMGKFVSFLTKAGVPEVTAFELQTIFYEVATNIRRHSGLTESDTIQLFAQVKDRNAVMTFTDSGLSFDPVQPQPKRDIKQISREAERRGFGLDMIVRLSDSIDYERVDGSQNRLRIEKGW